MKGRRFATKKDFAGGTRDYTKKCFSEVLRGLEKALVQLYYNRWDYFEEDKIDYRHL